MFEKLTEGRIEVGAADDTFRLWLAREAMRQGELRLAGQASARSSMEARATAMTGWASAGLLALGAASFASKTLQQQAAAIAAIVVMLIAAGLCIAAMRPREWSPVGYDPDTISSTPHTSELEVLEANAAGFSSAVRYNDHRLDGTARLLRWAGWALVAAPLAGAATYVWAAPLAATSSWLGA